MLISTPAQGRVLSGRAGLIGHAGATVGPEGYRKAVPPADISGLMVRVPIKPPSLIGDYGEVEKLESLN